MQNAFTWLVAESPAALLLLVCTFSGAATNMMNKIESVEREAKLREEALGMEAKLRDEALGREVILRDELLKAQLEYTCAMGLKKK